MQQYGFRSLLVLTKIGYDLRDQFADTFHEPADEVFGSLLNALDNAEGVLSLAPNEYQWLSNDLSFTYVGVGK
ncbi:hypothetical protein OCOJLMKI_5279 [Methylobacterium iners]|uniref:Uncharacterized protein n=1 Tax=Methylobacterium iners TaxID=418707 RepID=A0ABQ4S8P6_9HYPH|nr:hypothetical protein OCOJLMKI_5279 [Methylobacterium iners]